MSSSLEFYITQVSSQRRVFDHGLTHSPPRLHPGKVNRILLFPGAFNPPHRGHLDLLRHTIDNCGSDANVIGAVIFPIDDEDLQQKLRSESSSLLLHKHERVRLWRGHVPADDFWVYDDSKNALRKFQHQLIDRVTQDGLELKFSLLCGPDHMQDMSDFPSEPWGCKEIFFSDISRDTNLLSKGSISPEQLDLYGPWKRTVIDCEGARKIAESSTSFVISGLFMMGPNSANAMLEKDPDMVAQMVESFYMGKIESASKVWLACRKDDPSCTVRFIPKSNDNRKHTSSTEIRQLMKRYIPGQYFRHLTDSVLHVEILDEIMLSRSRRR